MKIGVISDLHLGFRQYGLIEREQDFYQQFLLVCQKLNALNVDMVIIAGDLFNNPNPSPAAINAYRQGIRSLSADFIIAITGNHTMILRDNHYSIDEFFSNNEFENYYLLDDDTFDTKEHGYDMRIVIDGITYRNDSNIDDFLETQKHLASKSYKDSVRILVVHQSFKEYCGFVGEELSVYDIDTSPYDLIICGHIHSRDLGVLEDGTFFLQPGSIERMNKTEALDEEKNQKGVYIFDSVERDISFYPVSCERKFFLGKEKINDVDEIKKFYDKIKKEAAKLDLPPIISYDFYNSGQNIEAIRNYVLEKKENILLDNSNIYDDIQNEDIVVEISDTEIPTILNVLKTKAEEHLNEDDSKFAVTLFSLLKEDSEGVKNVMDDYLEKRSKKNKIKDTEFNYEKENDFIKKAEEYIDSL